MKILVISYSLTGNNEALAKKVTEEFASEHIRVTEPKPRATGKIMMDMIFNKTPKVQPSPDVMKNYDMILFFGPVWMGHTASPLRPYLYYLKANPRKYAFVSISGGALGPNPKLAKDLKKRTGSEPAAIIDQHIAGLLPPEPKPTMKVTMAYRVIDKDIEKLTEKISKTLREKI